jgi:hypothetical protein
MQQEIAPMAVRPSTINGSSEQTVVSQRTAGDAGECVIDELHAAEADRRERAETLSTLRVPSQRSTASPLMGPAATAERG